MSGFTASLKSFGDKACSFFDRKKKDTAEFAEDQSQKTKEVLSTAGSDLKNFAGGVADSTKKAALTVKDKAGETYDSAKGGAQKKTEGAKEFAVDQKQKTSEVLSTAGSDLKNFAVGVADSTKKAALTVKEKTGETYDSAKGGAQKKTEGAKEFAVDQKQKTSEVLSTAGSDLKNFAGGVADNTKKAAHYVKDKAGETYDGAKTGAQNMTKKTGDKIDSVEASVGEKISQANDSAHKKLDDLNK